jgi:hypothetical protein
MYGQFPLLEFNHTARMQEKQAAAAEPKKTKKTAEKKVFVNKTPVGQKKGACFSVHELCFTAHSFTLHDKDLTFGTHYNLRYDC